MKRRNNKSKQAQSHKSAPLQHQPTSAHQSKGRGSLFDEVDSEFNVVASTKVDQSPVYAKSSSRKHASLDEAVEMSQQQQQPNSRRGRKPKSIAVDSTSDNRLTVTDVTSDAVAAASSNSNNNTGDVHLHLVAKSSESQTIPTKTTEFRSSDKVPTDLAALSHTQRKASKRELKALLRQSKKRTVTIDDKVVAVIDELTSLLKNNCLIDPNMPSIRPVAIASDPPPVVATKAKGGRRGRGASVSKKEPAKFHMPASWTPLLLPNTNQLLTNDVGATHQQTTAMNNGPVLRPWIHHLSEARICRFVANMNRLLSSLDVCTSKTSSSAATTPPFVLPSPAPSSLSQHYNSNALHSLHSVTAPIVSNLFATKPLNGIILGDSHSAHHNHHNHHHNYHHQHRHQSLFGSSTADDQTIDSRPPPPTTHRRGRVKSRRPFRKTTRVADASTMKLPKVKNQIPRELRGLITWDAVKAEQQRHGPAIRDQGIKEFRLRHSQAALTVVTDLLATVEDEMVHPRPRRTRQSSGSAPSNHTSSHSFGGGGAESETTSNSMQTTIAASECISADCPLYHAKHSACSTHSTEASGSSVSSDRPAHATAATSSTKSAANCKPPAAASTLVSVVESESPSYSGRRSGERHTAKEKAYSNRLLMTYSTTTTAADSNADGKYSPVSTTSHLSVDHQTDSLSTTPATIVKRSKKDTTQKRSRQDESIANQLSCSQITPRRGGGGGSALPPRKRYKVGMHTTSSPQPVGEDRGLLDVAATAADDGGGGGVVVDLNESCASFDEIEVLVKEDKGEVALGQSKKRGRGRPPRRDKQLVLTSSTDELPPSSSTTVLQPVSVSGSAVMSPVVVMDRPKREAAALGFASLVAANLNQCCLPAVNNVTSDAPADEAPVKCDSPVAVTVADKPSPALPAATPIRGRGRPPKHKADKGGKSAANQAQNPSFTAKRRHLIDSLPTNALVDDCKCPTDQSISPDRPDESVRSTAKCVDDDGERRVGGGGGDDDDVCVALTQQDLVSTVVNDVICSSNGKSSISSSSTTSSCSFGHIKDSNSSGRQSPFINADPFPPPTVTSHISSLPNRVHMFQGSLISSRQLDCRASSPNAKFGPVFDLFETFFNLPDPNEPDYCLCAPIVYLPLPEQNPDFYRFILSSSSSNAILPIHFDPHLIRRVFNPTKIQSTTDLPSPTTNLYNLEFPSLCLASIGTRFVSSSDGCPPSNFCRTMRLSEHEQSLVAIQSNDLTDGLQTLDAALDCLFYIWETFVGRRSWLGRRMIQLKAAYLKLRTDFVTDLVINQNLTISKSLKKSISLTQTATTKKKTDRRALERGAEVIRCMCGFRVEGGHVMVQCDRCASWQHLPCLWWALSLAISKGHVSGDFLLLCKSALIAAQAIGSTDNAAAKSSDDTTGADAPYFCPVCLNINGLTKDYPRSLSAAMSLNDLSAVRGLQETTAKSQLDYWSLTSPDHHSQIRTDDYAFVSRFWLDAKVPTSKTVRSLIAKCSQHPVTCIHDVILIRIYRLWKDASDQAWLEGGLFLRPYDLSQSASDISSKWHANEVVYDESSRLVLPLEAWICRRMVLCPSAYRTGRSSDLVDWRQLNGGEWGMALSDNDKAKEGRRDCVFFVCDRLIQRSSNGNSSGGGEEVRFEEICPGYLKVNMKPYCFLRKPSHIHASNRSCLVRNYSTAELLEFDRSTPFTIDASDDNDGGGGDVVENDHVECVVQAPNESTTVEEPSTQPVVSDEQDAAVDVSPPVAKPFVECKSNVLVDKQTNKPKGEKLAKVVDWLERKLQTQVASDRKPFIPSSHSQLAKTDDDNQQPEKLSAAAISTDAVVKCEVPSSDVAIPNLSARGDDVAGDSDDDDKSPKTGDDVKELNSQIDPLLEHNCVLALEESSIMDDEEQLFSNVCYAVLPEMNLAACTSTVSSFHSQDDRKDASFTTVAADDNNRVESVVLVVEQAPAAVADEVHLKKSNFDVEMLVSPPSNPTVDSHPSDEQVVVQQRLIDYDDSSSSSSSSSESQHPSEVVGKIVVRKRCFKSNWYYKYRQKRFTCFKSKKRLRKCMTTAIPNDNDDNT